MLRKVIYLLAVLVFAAAGVFAQAPKPSVVSGDVKSVGTENIVIADKNGEVTVVLSASTAYKRVSPENLSLSAATAASLSDINVGDKVMASGILSDDKKTLPARSVYLITKSDLSQKAQKDSDMWRTRGVQGKVVSVNAQTNQVVLESGGLMGKTSITLTPKADAKFLRYAPDSIKFADAKTSSIGEIKAGDEIRAMGDKSADGTAFAADTVLTGGFRQSAGKVKSVDVAAKQVVIEDMNTKKDVTISFADAVMMKRFPEEMAARMAGMQMGGGPGAPGGAQPAGGVQVVRPVGGGQPQAMQNGQAGPRPMGGGGRALGDFLERVPTMPAEDIKVGEYVAVLTSGTTAGSDHVKAIKLVAGVDPFIKMAQMAQAMGGQRQGGGRGVDINIPGLDSSMP